MVSLFIIFVDCLLRGKGMWVGRTVWKMCEVDFLPSQNWWGMQANDPAVTTWSKCYEKVSVDARGKGVQPALGSL